MGGTKESRRDYQTYARQKKEGVIPCARPATRPLEESRRSRFGSKELSPSRLPKPHAGRQVCHNAATISTVQSKRSFFSIVLVFRNRSLSLDPARMRTITKDENEPEP